MIGMDKYKICPSCRHENAPNEVECVECGTDLMSVPVIDADKIARDDVTNSNAVHAVETDAEPSSNTPSVPGPGRYIRRCTCGAANPPNARECSICGEDISIILPILRAEEGEMHFTLNEVGSDYTFCIPCGCVVVGREHAMRECLSGKHFVSRIHAKLTVEDGMLYVENLSSTNYTFVNNIKVPTGRSRLQVGDELAFGGIAINGMRQEDAAYFIVGSAL